MCEAHPDPGPSQGRRGAPTCSQAQSASPLLPKPRGWPSADLLLWGAAVSPVACERPQARDVLRRPQAAWVTCGSGSAGRTSQDAQDSRGLRCCPIVMVNSDHLPPPRVSARGDTFRSYQGQRTQDRKPTLAPFPGHTGGAGVQGCWGNWECRGCRGCWGNWGCRGSWGQALPGLGSGCKAKGQ